MKILILGGAGFLGSHIVDGCLAQSHQVTVIDGLMPKTGASLKNLTSVIKQIQFIDQPIEKVKSLPQLLSQHDVIIDCMAWTSHLAAFADPFYDSQLNLLAHLTLIQALPNGYPGKIIYLGSRGQFGQVAGAVLNEETEQKPLDVQGIHKTAAENYFRVYALKKQLKVISLRLPNCFGPRQPMNRDDIGLVGSFIRDFILKQTVVVFGEARYRNILYSHDLKTIINRLLTYDVQGFEALNLAGTRIAISDLAHQLWQIIKTGAIENKKTPVELAQIDIGSTLIAEEKFNKIFSSTPFTHAPLAQSLAVTVADVLERIKQNDLSL